MRLEKVQEALKTKKIHYEIYRGKRMRKHRLYVSRSEIPYMGI
mgnify:CR=1 FL=1